MAGQGETPSLSEAIQQLATVSTQASKQQWSAELVQFLTMWVLGFACIALVLAAILLWRARSSSVGIVRAFGMILIISLSTFLVIVGYGNEQLTPIVGLFGAIAGYLLGKDSGPPTPAPEPKEPKDATPPH